MQLIPLMTLTAQIGETLHIGDGGCGIRRIAPITGGTFEGERMRGVVLPVGADWTIRDSGGYGRIDVRLVLRTDDGTNIYMNYRGYLELGQRTAAARHGDGETEFGDLDFCTQIRFETGAERYGWLNHCVAAGEGRLLPDAVQYRIYRIVAG